MFTVLQSLITPNLSLLPILTFHQRSPTKKPTMNCLGSQSRNYAPLPEDSDSTLPPTSASESASTDNFTPSTATTASAGEDGAAAGASDGIASPPAVSISPSSRLNVAPSRGRSSSARGRRSNGGGAGHPFHHSHHHNVPCTGKTKQQETVFAFIFRNGVVKALYWTLLDLIGLY